MSNLEILAHHYSSETREHFWRVYCKKCEQVSTSYKLEIKACPHCLALDRSEGIRTITANFTFEVDDKISDKDFADSIIAALRTYHEGIVVSSNEEKDVAKLVKGNIFSGMKKIGEFENK